MKTNSWHRIVLAFLLVATVVRVRAAEEDDLIATLQSPVSAPQKWAACQRLRLIGTAKAVPALAGLLSDERASQAARHTLEALPFPEAGAALRDALGKTSGTLRAGVIDSLGWRGEAAAVTLLAPLLSEADNTIASSTAVALGRIGGPEAVRALSAVLETAPQLVQPSVQEALLKCAERLLAASDNSSAAEIYRRFSNARFPVQVRTAGWRGLMLSDSAGRTDRMLEALGGSDRPIQVAALKLLRELNDRAVVQACVGRWSTLPPESQLAILDAQVKLGIEAMPTARAASQSPDLALRAAAWHALGELNDTASVAALSKAAANGETAEREAARESLTRLRGPGAREALLAYLAKADAPEKAELLTALGERDDRAAVDILLQNAASEAPQVRLAALGSLTRLAPQETVAPLMELAAKSKSDDQRDPVLTALFAVCEASPNKAEAARSVVETMGRFSPLERRQILPLLAELATPEALAAAQTASRDAEPELAKESIRVLSRWPNAAPAPQLLDLARSSSNATIQTLALRGAIEVIGQEPDAAKRFAFLQQALATAKQSDEKKQVLSQLGQVPTREALDLALKQTSDPALVSEAYLSSLSIVEKLAASDPKLGDEVAAQVLTHFPEGDVARRAWALRLKPSSGASFLRDWVVCGPYREPGIVGAQAIFNVAFGPEKPGQKMEWSTAPPADHINLAALFPGAENCVAYLRTHILASKACRGTLLMGSDDGLKVWLNGELVHSNNVDRGEVVDQDAAPIQLKEGANELVLKVSQGGGGWSACARIVGPDGKPIPGLLVERPSSPARELSATAKKGLN